MKNISPVLESIARILFVLIATGSPGSSSAFDPFLAVLAPVISPYNPVEQHITDQLKGPSAKYWLGTDEYGRDLFSRIVWGARISLTVGTISVILGMIIGSILGMYAGYRGGVWDDLIMRAMDVFMSIPTLLMGLFVVAVLGPSMVNLIVAIALTVVPRFARIARAPTVSIKNGIISRPVGPGFSDLRIMTVHVLPNILTHHVIMWIATAVTLKTPLALLVWCATTNANVGGVVED